MRRHLLGWTPPTTPPGEEARLLLRGVRAATSSLAAENESDLWDRAAAARHKMRYRRASSMWTMSCQLGGAP